MIPPHDNEGKQISDSVAIKQGIAALLTTSAEAEQKWYNAYLAEKKRADEAELRAQAEKLRADKAEKENQFLKTHFASNEKQPEPESKPKPEREVEDVTFEEINTYCRYLDRETIKRTGIRTTADVQKQLEQKSKEDAKSFVTFLRDQIKLKYINFHGDTTASIFANLHKDLPMMRDYSLNNFYTYFRDEPL